MKNAILEFLEPTEEEKKLLWEKATFIFDTNVLLNLYRYSKKTRDILFSAIEELKERIWIPYHIAFEFMQNRSSIIYETVDLYDKLLKEAEAFNIKCKEALRLKQNDLEIIQLHEYISQWIDANKRKNLLVLNPLHDPILSRILDLYAGKVGRECSNEEIKQISEDGLKRYEKQIPPGYKDIGKKSPSGDENIYGDLIIWMQLMEYSKKHKRDIVYVTHDQKEDWWNIVRGKTIGPRVELRKEFFSCASQKFDMYSMDSFINRFGKLHGAETDQSVIDEIRLFDREYNSRRKKGKQYISKKEQLSNDILRLQDQIEKREKIVSQIERKYQQQEMTEAVRIQVENTKTKIDQLRVQKLKVEDKYNSTSCDNEMS